MRVRKRVPILEAWQYNSTDKDRPLWVTHAIRYNSKHEIVLIRSTGDQVINLGDWLIRDLDSKDHSHYIDDDFQREFEAV